MLFGGRKHPTPEFHQLYFKTIQLFFSTRKFIVVGLRGGEILCKYRCYGSFVFVFLNDANISQSVNYQILFT